MANINNNNINNPAISLIFTNIEETGLKVNEDNTIEEQGYYLKSIDEFRSAVGESKQHDILVLRPQVPNVQNTKWLHLRLISAIERNEDIQRSVTLIFNLTDLYLWGYLRENGEYWVFSGNEINGTKSFGFGDSYRSMEAAAGRYRGTLNLGYYRLQQSIIDLADEDHPQVNFRDTATALLVIIQMFPEAMRFKHIAEHIAKGWKNGTQLEEEMLVRENNWKNISKKIFESDDWGPATSFSSTTDALKGFKTYGAIMNALGVFANPEKSSTPSSSSSGKRVKTRSRTLASIEYLSLLGEGAFHIVYGTVMVVDCWSGVQFLYNRLLLDAEKVGQNSCISLIDPCFAISGEDTVTIVVKLLEKRSDDLLASDVFVWDHRDAGNVYDQLLQRPIGNGFSLAYVVIKEALIAKIEVEILSNAENLAGFITTTRYLGEQFESLPRTLFAKRESMSLCQGQFILLDRPCFPIPANSAFKIDVKLWDGNTVFAMSDLEFLPLIGKQSQIIYGARKLEKVKVHLHCMLFDD